MHSLAFEGEKWRQIDYLEGFLPPSPISVCAYAETTSSIVGFNGTVGDCIILLPDRKFGARLAVDTVLKFDSPRVATNRLGMCVAISTTGQALASANGKAVELGPVKADSRCPIAIAPGVPMVATTGPDLTLVATSMLGSVKKTAARLTPALQTKPIGMAWTRRGELLIVGMEDGTWAIYRPMGLV